MYALTLCCVLPIASTDHFLGGSIMVRPKPGLANTDLEVLCTQMFMYNTYTTICDWICENLASLRAHMHDFWQEILN